MKITFVLPALIKIPSGGAKVVYRYAEELNQLGHDTTILLPIREGNNIKDIIKYFSVRLRDYYHSVLNEPYYTSKIASYKIISTPIAKHFPNSDVVIATGWQTAYWVDALPRSKGKKYYFIQNDETYQGDYNRIRETWRLPLKKIVISNWLKKSVEELGEKVYGVVPNAVDIKEFYPIKAIFSDREKYISMLYHRYPIKGGKEGIKVLKQTKKLYPKLKATIISARKPKIKIPNWIQVKVRPNRKDLNKIYNLSTIFIHTSHQEGWGLPPMEAMACKCAVVSASNDGVKEFIEHNKSGLMSPIGEVDSMIKNIKFLFENPKEKERIIINGYNKIQGYSWKKSAVLFESILTN